MRTKNTPTVVLSWIITIIIVIMCFFPFYWIIVSSLKGPSDILTSPPSLFMNNATLVNYQKAITNNSLIRYTFNSLFISSCTVLLTLLIITPAGYAIGYLKLPGTRRFSSAMLITQFLPIIVIIIPLFTLSRRLGLLNTPWALILTYLSFNVPVGIILSSNYFNTIPKSLGEAALVEGCNSFLIFSRITLPLTLPGLAATSIYIFINIWQEFLVAISFISESKQFTLPVGLTSYVGQYNTDWGGLMATSVIVGMPAIIIFLFFQKYFIDNIAGAVKG
ncbi:MAG: carbohydrate ABC transporter permease [Spirochaetia bacterium]|nr:carbohydrate ABC transporter permease [Spirochaetia bacterium]